MAVGESKKPLAETVVDWLEKQGYRLEYEACHAFNGTERFIATMGEYLCSEDTWRELDVVARAKVRSEPFCEIVCEYKYSVAKPFVLLFGDQKSSQPIEWLAMPRSATA